VVDDGWSWQEVDEIERYCRKHGLEPRIRCAWCRKKAGLLHARIYLAEWGTESNAKARLIWGSLNASLNGFQVNAEVGSGLTLAARQKARVLRYLQPLWGESDKGAVQPQLIPLTRGIQLHLPGFQFAPRTRQRATFDAWVQSGRLCHKFQRDPAFAKLSIKLKKPLPPEGLERDCQDAGLRRDAESDMLRYPYVEETDRERSDSASHWRASYFIETWLGFWTSDSCFQAMHERFRAKNCEQRRAVITQIRDSTEDDRRKWCGCLINAIRDVCTAMSTRKNERPSDYFRMRGNEIDVDYYFKNSVKELHRHRAWAQDKVFRDRFIHGYVFPPLPRFRGAEAVDEGSYEDFLKSFCETVATARNKSKSTNLLIRAIHEVYRTTELGTAEQVLMILRRDWHIIGDYVERFYSRK
jgi:hypothetical protein